MDSTIPTVEAEYIKNLQQQIYFLELEANFLREQTKKAANLQPRLTTEAGHLSKKLQELHSQCNGLKLEIKRKEANLLMVQREQEQIKDQIHSTEEAHYKDKQQLTEEIVKLKKIKEQTDLQISQKEMEILRSKQEMERELVNLSNSEQRGHSLQSQIKQRSEQQKAVESQLSEKRMEILKLNSAMHEMEEKLFKRASTTQHQITSDLRNQISFLHQQVREKELLSEQDRLLRSKMMADCARLANENNALQIQLLELNKQQDIQRALKEEGYIHDSSSFAHLLSVKDREGRLNSEVKWQQELLELEKSNFKDIMEQITMLNKDSKFQDLSSTTISSRIAEMHAILAKEDHINTELRRDKALLVDHVSNLQTQLGSKDDELLQIFSKIAELEEGMSVLKSQQSLDKILHSERWKEIFDMTSSMKTLTTSIADSSLSSRK